MAKNSGIQRPFFLAYIPALPRALPLGMIDHFAVLLPFGSCDGAARRDRRLVSYMLPSYIPQRGEHSCVCMVQKMAVHRP